MKQIRAIVVDDEKKAREGLTELLKSREGIELLCTCTNGLEAIKEINDQQPDLVFLDIQMPRVNGFEVLSSINTSQMPAIVFVTAYDKYALRAFEVHAIDYLLKPFDNSRFDRALQKAIDHINSNKTNSNVQLEALLQDFLNQQTQKSEIIKTERNSSQKIIIKSGGKIYFLKPEEIIWLEAQDYYIKIHTKNASYLVRESLKKMEAELPQNFIRIHKSSIVNVDYIQVIEPHFRGDYHLTLTNKQQLRISRNYRENINKYIGK